ncbi:hypothetical protein BJP40_10805 [Streptomyces sp. CC53]|uniref:DUF6571 family protein n=1 Tax=unclassified Streptomyces TaxID=2593676 RepID=UPI0008DDDCD2|nr:MULTISPECIES: DUF6571 family protein [unclassified Streptomyces]OII60306.1 hypothetical protein BJP40_10805 [Streptomyces sp. CC53]
MITLRELHDLRLGKLKAAVEDWEQMVRKLAALAQGGDDVNAADFAARAEGADWQGDNAAVTKAFTVTTARQFTDIVTEARSIHAVLRDAHTALAKHHRDLVAAVDKWSAKHVRFDDAGGAHPVSRKLPDNSTHTSATQEDVDAAAAEVGSILAAANEVDRIATRALRGHAESAHDFDETGHRSLQDADRHQGRQDADLLVGLARKGDALTEAELRRFNAVMEYQRDNPAFAERFATGLGAEGTLRFWQDLADPRQSFLPDGERGTILATVQENLSLTLAAATHVDSPAMNEWKAGVLASGDERLRPGGPYGFQLVSSLMTKGTWGTDFLTSYGEKLIEFERDSGKRGGPYELWSSSTVVPHRLAYPYDPSGKANDPFNGFLEALGHNPEAALRFFGDHTGGGDEDGPKRVDNLDYLLGTGQDEKDNRAWPLGFDRQIAGYEFLGHALESATLGFAYDDGSPSVPPTRTQEQVVARNERTELMERLVEHYRSSSEIDAHDGIRGSLARMAAGHIDSLTYSMDNFGGSGEAIGRDALYGADRHHLRDFDRADSTAFLRALASDREAYETVSVAQQVYGTSAMAAHGDDVASARHVGLRSVYLHGFLDEVRSEAIGKEFAEEAEQRNLELEKQAAWRGYATSALVGAGVGVGAALVTGTGVGAILIPIAIETVGGAVETQVETETMQWLQDNKFDNSQQAIDGLDAAREAGEKRAATPLLNWAEARGMPRSEVSDLMAAAEGRYGEGAQNADTDNARGW